MTGVADNKTVVGLIPAAGIASRISPLPCSKEIFPVGFKVDKESGRVYPKVISHHLLEAMQSAGISDIYMVLKKGKWDIPSYFGSGKVLDMNIAYLIMDLPFGVPFTLDQAFSFVKDRIVALGFPDIKFEPSRAYRDLLSKQAETDADIVLGIFPAPDSYKAKTDMVKMDDRGRVVDLHIKPETTDLTYTWQIAVWSPTFSQYMHDHLQSVVDEFYRDKKKKEIYVGDVIRAAIKDNLHIETVIFDDGTCIDIGTPDDLKRIVRSELQN